MSTTNRPTLTFTLPLHLPSLANDHRHWRQRHASTKALRTAAHLATAAHWRNFPPSPWLITLTRTSPRPLDGDNLQTAFKPVRDGIADGLAPLDRVAGNRSRRWANDSAPVFRWAYDQKKGPRPEITVTITTAPTRRPAA